jgi:WD40 repeat protein
MKSRCFSYALALAVVLLFSPSFSRGDAPSTPAADDAPILQITPDGHTSQVCSMVWTPDGKQLISAGADKVIRIWDTASGEIVRELRGQIGSGSQGKMYAAALSPDGKTLVVGGYGMNGHWGDIRCFDLQSGTIRRVWRGHESTIIALTFSPDGSTLASGSHDFTVRVWDMESGRNRIVGRHEAAISNIAWSPDGKRLASSSYDKTARVWAVEKEKQAATQPLFTVHHDDEALCVAWSPDGKTLATGSNVTDKRNLRLWNATNGEPLPIELLYQKNDVSCLAFSADGSTLVSTISGVSSADFAVRYWSLPSGKMEREFTALKSGGAFALAFSPDGSRIAVAGDEDNSIYLLDAKTLQTQKHLVGNGLTTIAVAWSPDGKRLAWGNTRTKWATNDRGPIQYSFDLLAGIMGKDVAEGESWRMYQTERNGRSLKQIKDAVLTLSVTEGEREIMRLRNGTETVDRMRCMTWTPDGGIVIGSDFTLALYDSAGVRAKRFVGHLAVIWAVAVSADGKYLASVSGDQTVRIWPMSAVDRIGKGWIGVTGEMGNGGYRITEILEGPATAAHLQVGDVITALDGKPITSGAEIKATIEAKRRGQQLLVGFERAGQKLEVPLTVYAYDDEVDPLLSLWMGRDREWVAWTPQGYYACSPKAERVIGWHVNRGEDKAADFYPAFQFRKQLYRPDIIQLLTTAGSVEKAIEMADAKRAQKTDKQLVAGNIGSFAPPKVEIYAPGQKSVIAVPAVTVRARITDPNGRAIRSIRLLINGRDAGEIAEDGKPITADSRPITADGKPITVDGKAITAESKAITAESRAITADSRTLTNGSGVPETAVKLPPDGIWQKSTTLVPGVNTLSVVAVNDAGAESLPAQIEVTYLATEKKPAVFVLAAGVSQYQQEKYSLGFAAKDADDFVGMLQSQENRRFGKVSVRNLTNAGASKSAILDGLDWLKKNVGQNDWAILFLSGHGLDWHGQYFFAPYDFDAELVELTGLPWADLQSGLRLPGRVLLVLDSCRAGGAAAQSYNDTLRQARDGGIITFASCLPHEISQESKEWNNGAFTKALVEAFEGKADTDGNKTVTLSEADDYVSKRVIALTENAQHTTWPRPTGVESSLALAVLQ